jgi:hypothetical protein
LCDEDESDTTRAYFQEFGESPNGNVSADEEQIEPSPPRLSYEKLAQKKPKPTEHLSITLGPPMIILFDIVVPCTIYYVCTISIEYNGRITAVHTLLVKQLAPSESSNLTITFSVMRSLLLE